MVIIAIVIISLVAALTSEVDIGTGLWHGSVCLSVCWSVCCTQL